MNDSYNIQLRHQSQTQKNRHYMIPFLQSSQTGKLIYGVKSQKSGSHSVMSNFLQPHGLHSPWNSPGQNTGVGSLSFSRGSSQSKSPTLQADSLPAEPQGKPKNTGVSSLSLLQWIFPTQESNQGLLHCRQILYELIYQGFASPPVM